MSLPGTRYILAVLLAVLVRADLRPLAAAPPDTVLLRASAAFAPCLPPALDAFTRASGVRVALEVGEPDPPREADAVVGDDSEMVRLLEGGGADASAAVDLGYVPWVTVAPPGSAAGALALSTERVAVLGGRAGTEAREFLGRVASGPPEVTRDAATLARSPLALVPRTLAGEGERHPAPVRPLVAVLAPVTGSARRAAVDRLIAFLRQGEGRRALGACLDAPPAAQAVAAPAQAAYAAQVMDWWLPQCSLNHDRYNDPAEVLGPPDAVNLGGVDNYQGFMSLGQGGWVIVDMGTTVVDGPGPDIRVFQTTANEPVTLYAGSAPDGPFTLVGLRVTCGVRSPGLLSNHCDFDLHDGGLASARYFKVEDGEVYPCLAGGTYTEGPDIDAVQALSTGTAALPRP